jgi:hypothetical protein
VRLVDYASASTLTEEDLDNDSLQAFYMVQEAIDAAATALGLDSNELWDATSKKIINVADPTADQDAATKAYVDSVVIALGNVPGPGNPSEDNYVLTASAGSWSWAAITASSIAAGTITGTEIATNTIDGTHIALGSDAQGDVMYYNGTDWARLGAGTNGQYLQTQGAGANPQWATVGAAGAVQQVQFASSTSNTDITTTIPLDNTVPQNTEGDEVITVAITPSASDSTILIEFGFAASQSSNGTYSIGAIFVDSTAGALTAALAETDSSAATHVISGACTHAPGDTSAHTYKLRVGPSSGTCYLNQGAAGANLFSTAGPHAYIKVTEILA